MITVHSVEKEKKESKVNREKPTETEDRNDPT